SRRKSGSDAPDTAAPDRLPSPAPAAPPAQSSPSLPASILRLVFCVIPRSVCCDGTARNPISQLVRNPRSTSHGSGAGVQKDVARGLDPNDTRGIAMTVIGYARVSTIDQNLEIQEAALKAAGCEVIRSEKRSGTTTAGRVELQTVLDFLRHGDVLVVTR